MNEMIERITRVFIAQFGPVYGRMLDTDDARRCARAAILAMREPTAAMIAANNQWGLSVPMCRAGWHQMIDEIIK